MGRISAREYHQRLQKVKNLTVLRELVYEELIKDEETLKLLKEQDFLEGDIHGNNTLFSYRNKPYELWKYQKNPLAGGAVDLINTGAFVDAMKLNKPSQGKYRFGNTDKKRNILKEIYGQDIFGLNQEVFDKYLNEIIKPRFYRRIKEYAKIS